MFYHIIGKDKKDLYDLGYTSNKNKALRYFIFNGWKKENIIFKEKEKER